MAAHNSNNQRPAATSAAAPAPVYVSSSGTTGVFPVASGYIPAPATVIPGAPLPRTLTTPAANTSFGAAQSIPAPVSQPITYAQPTATTYQYPVAPTVHSVSHPVYSYHGPGVSYVVGGTPIPIQQAPHNTVPIVIQQPVENPPTRIVYVQQQPTTAAVPQVVAGNASSATTFAPFAAAQSNSDRVRAQVEFARANGVYEPQDFKPADDNPNRLYWCREPNNEYTLRNRRTIDQMGCIWYIMPDGTFYAVKKA